MTEPQGTDISAADLDVTANDEVSETGDPDAYDEDATLGGVGGAETTSGGAG
ncbi:MAG: hypothetical protein M3P46_06400 [Actinomycetota bacterium]|nr:hypothetical protein [Actinomycetota bacterium]